MRISDWSSDLCSSDLRQSCVAPILRLPRQLDALHHRIEHLAARFVVARVAVCRARPQLWAGGGVIAERDHVLVAQGQRRMAALLPGAGPFLPPRGARSEARRVGKECVDTVRTR